MMTTIIIIIIIVYVKKFELRAKILSKDVLSFSIFSVVFIFSSFVYEFISYHNLLIILFHKKWTPWRNKHPFLHTLEIKAQFWKMCMDITATCTVLQRFLFWWRVHRKLRFCGNNTEVCLVQNQSEVMGDCHKY